MREKQRCAARHLMNLNEIGLEYKLQIHHQPVGYFKSGGVVGYVCDFAGAILKIIFEFVLLKSEKVSTTPPLFAAVQASNHITRSRVDLVKQILSPPGSGQSRRA